MNAACWCVLGTIVLLCALAVRRFVKTKGACPGCSACHGGACHCKK